MSQMIGVKTSELIGLSLDWAVGIADGRELELPSAISGRTGVVWCEPFDIRVQGEVIGHDKTRRYWKPSTDWSQGGPLIERERIGLWPDSNGYFAEKRHFGRHHKAGRNYGEGATPLVAAMRCFCAAKLGDTVQVPQELLP